MTDLNKMRGPVFPAKKDGSCGRCGANYLAGDRIQYAPVWLAYVHAGKDGCPLAKTRWAAGMGPSR